MAQVFSDDEVMGNSPKVFSDSEAMGGNTDLDMENQIKSANEKQGFWGNIGEGINNLAHGNIHDTALGRGAERGTLGLLQASGLGNTMENAVEKYTGAPPESGTQALADIAKQTRIAGEGTGVSGSIGEALLDPRYDAMLATGPMGWAGRAAVGTAIGATNPVETSDPQEALKQRAISGAESGAGFALIPPLVEGAGNLAKKAATPLINKITGSEAISPAYQKIANALIKQEGYSPEEALKAAQGMNENIPEGETPTKLPLTLPEATESDRLLKQQRVLGELSSPAGTTFSDFNKNRLDEVLPQAKENLVGNYISLPDAGEDIQKAAKDYIDNQVNIRRQATAPQYESIKMDKIDPDDIQELRSNPSIEKAYQRVLGDDALTERKYQYVPTVPDAYKSSLGVLPQDQQFSAMKQLGIQPQIERQVTGGLPEDSIGFWHKVKQELDSNYETNEIGKATPAGRLAKNSATNVNDVLEAANPTYATTNEDYASKSSDIQKLVNSPLGKLRDAKTPEQAGRNFMNLSREQLQDIVPKLNESNPQAVPQMASAYMRELTDRTSDSGLKTYINTMSRNDLVRDKMKAILGDDGFEAQQDLVDNIRKVIAGQPRNSETFSKAQIYDEMHQGEMGNFVDPALDIATGGKTAFMKIGLRWLGGMKDAARSKMFQESDKQLMDVFLNPDLNKLYSAMRGASAAQKQDAVLQYIGEQVSGKSIEGNKPQYKRGGYVQPTEAQKHAGNYKKQHITWNGLNISIENPKGSTRSGTDKTGKSWKVRMPVAYGYFKRTEGADGDHMDCYVGPRPDSKKVWIIDQKHLDTGKFDENKAMIGFPTKGHALNAYRKSFSDGNADKRIKAISECSIDELKHWLKSTKEAA